MICYMAGPIDYAKDKGIKWKEELIGLCVPNKNIGFFDPLAPFKFQQVDREMAIYIHDVNTLALDRADIVVGSFMHGQTSVGTPIELYSVMRHKPIIVHTDMDESVYMQYINSVSNVKFVSSIHKLYVELIDLVSAIEYADEYARSRACCDSDSQTVADVTLNNHGMIPLGKLNG